jgi:hypothetical protein
MVDMEIILGGMEKEIGNMKRKNMRVRIVGIREFIWMEHKSF